MSRFYLRSAVLACLVLGGIGAAWARARERPALQRQLRGPVPETLQPFLARYCESVALDACALVRGQDLITTTPGPIEWDLVLAAASEQGERFLITGAAPKMALSGAQAGVAEHAGISVIVVEARGTLLMDRPDLERAATAHGISIVGLRHG